MQQEATEELHGREGHRLLLIPRGVILPTERHPTILQGDQSLVGYGDAVGVTGKVLQNLLGAAEWRLRVDHPLRAVARGEQSLEGIGLHQFCQAAMKGELVLAKACFR